MLTYVGVESRGIPHWARIWRYCSLIRVRSGRPLPTMTDRCWQISLLQHCNRLLHLCPTASDHTCRWILRTSAPRRSQVWLGRCFPVDEMVSRAHRFQKVYYTVPCLGVKEAVVCTNSIPVRNHHPCSFEGWRSVSLQKQVNTIQVVARVVDLIGDLAIAISGVNIVPERSH